LNIYMSSNKNAETFALNLTDGRFGKERAIFRWPKYLTK